LFGTGWTSSLLDFNVLNEKHDARREREGRLVNLTLRKPIIGESHNKKSEEGTW